MLRSKAGHSFNSCAASIFRFLVAKGAIHNRWRICKSNSVVDVICAARAVRIWQALMFKKSVCNAHQTNPKRIKLDAIPTLFLAFCSAVLNCSSHGSLISPEEIKMYPIIVRIKINPGMNSKYKQVNGA